MAAAHAGNWHQFVQLWDQLTGWQPALGRRLMSDVEQQMISGMLAGVDKLCTALMEAWVAAQQEVFGRMQQELADAVVSAAPLLRRWAGVQQVVHVVAGRGRQGKRGRS